MLDYLPDWDVVLFLELVIVLEEQIYHPLLLIRNFIFRLGVCVYLFDVVVLLGQAFFTSFEGILYGIITVFITAIVLDKVTIFGERESYRYLVISAHHEEIAEAIFKEIDRGCTFVNVTTGYFHDQQKAVLCVVNNREYPVINDLVMDY